MKSFFRKALAKLKTNCYRLSITEVHFYYFVLQKFIKNCELYKQKNMDVFTQCFKFTYNSTFTNPKKLHMIRSFLLSILLFIAFNTSFAQLNYLASSGVNTTTTYTDLGATGSVISTPGFDDNNSTIQNIGFNFLYNGTTYTQFVLNTNGFIKLGAIAPATTNIFDVLASAEADVIAPLNMDLDGATSPEYRVATTGVAPNRICTIQFKNVRDYFETPATAPQFASMQFQVRLYETSNNIEFVYGTFVAGAAAVNTYIAVAGIKGFDAPGSVNVLKANTTAWSAATFIDGNYAASNKFNIRKDVLPTAGRTFRFTSVALPANDARVLSAYTLARIPVSFGTPHIIKAVIRNGGGSTLTNLTVSLDVTGANTFSNSQVIASLAPGISVTVSFAGFSPVNAGTNTVAVSVPADDVNTNNSVSVSQTVTTNAFRYADNTASTRNIGYNTGAGTVLTKYTLTGAASVTNVNVFLANSASSVGNTVYAVVLDAAGTIVAQSANLIIAAGDLNAYKNFTIVSPPVLTNTDFYVGLAQTANGTTGYFPVGSQTELTPTRTGAFYRGPLAGGVLPTEITTQGRYMIEAIVAASPLPVTLADFSGKIQNNIAYLQWKTVFESNSDKFEIEKTAVTNGGNWLTIGSVKAAGNSSTTNLYKFNDIGLAPGEWLYRLKLIDKDGKFTYSALVKLKTGSKLFNGLSQNFPNPVKDVTSIPYQLAKDAIVTLELYSLDGKKVNMQQKGLQVEGAHSLLIDTRSLGLSNGKYIYRLILKDKATGEVSTLQKELNVIR